MFSPKNEALGTKGLWIGDAIAEPIVRRPHGWVETIFTVDNGSEHYADFHLFLWS